MKIFLCNRGNFKHQDDEGTPIEKTISDFWIEVQNLEHARTAVVMYLKMHPIARENWFGGHLIIGGSYEGCFDYYANFHRKGTEFADHRLVWLQAYQAKMRILRLSQMN